VSQPAESMGNGDDGTRGKGVREIHGRGHFASPPDPRRGFSPCEFTLTLATDAPPGGQLRRSGTTMAANSSFPILPPAEEKFSSPEPIWHKTAHWGVKVESAATVTAEDRLQKMKIRFDDEAPFRLRQQSPGGRVPTQTSGPESERSL
jgi:hypothetical protein